MGSDLDAPVPVPIPTSVLHSQGKKISHGGLDELTGPGRVMREGFLESLEFPIALEYIIEMK